ncbi:MAG TPA: hypothetical protein VFM18_19265 [Methanosarcina sp.]|nr:hypothetical protein [Methanosarcina sp.]
MKIRDIITEGDAPASGKKLPKDQQAAIKGAVSIPNISMNKANGSPYLQYRFGIALAGSPDYDTPPAGAIAGDPLLSTYTDADFEIIKKAAEMVGAGSVNQLTNNKSQESEDIQKASPMQAKGPIALKNKK